MNFRYFVEGVAKQETLDLGSKVRGENSISSEKVYEFEIIYPKRADTEGMPSLTLSLPYIKFCKAGLCADF